MTVTAVTAAMRSRPKLRPTGRSGTHRFQPAVPVTSHSGTEPACPQFRRGVSGRRATVHPRSAGRPGHGAVRDERPVAADQPPPAWRGLLLNAARAGKGFRGASGRTLVTGPQ